MKKVDPEDAKSCLTCARDGDCRVQNRKGLVSGCFSWTSAKERKRIQAEAERRRARSG